ncbi:thiol reductant ABC exporter subunit CydD [Rhizobium sp. PL01]|uniref:thiol reductant ABC exporter subunit CydD n=1 Tax=Rhizobium sp. PL01 TaxID=3085631 RepID=UPI0039919F45
MATIPSPLHLQRRGPDVPLHSSESLRAVVPVASETNAAYHTTMKSERRHAAAITLPAFLQILAALLWLPQAGLLAYAVGKIAEGAEIRDLVVISGLIFLVGLARTIIEASGHRIAFKAARTFLSRCRREATAALATSSPIDSSRATSGLVACVIGEQAEAIVPYLARYKPTRAKSAVVPLTILACILPLSWLAALILLFAGPIIPVFMALIGWRAKAASEAQLSQAGSMNGFLLDRLRGLRSIRTLGAVDLTAKRLRADADSLSARTMAVLRIAFLSSAVLELFAAIGVAMTAVYIGFHLLGALEFGAWGAKLSLSQGLFILLLAPAFFDPLRELSAVWHDKAAGDAAIEALDRLANSGVPLATQTGSVSLGSENAGPLAVHVEQLGFSHIGSSDPVFTALDLSIAPGEHVAIIGSSGSGKSTLLALLAGLCAPASGAVRIADTAGKPLCLEAVRTRTGWIGQTPHIFAGSLSANVSLKRTGVGVDEISTALNIASLSGVATAQGHRPIGDGGSGISGGEALRLAVARAAVNTQAGLILADEPTAHLDHGTAAEVTESLLALAAGKTLIIATHDPVLATRMDRIIRLDAEEQS